MLPNGLNWNKKKGAMYFNDFINSHGRHPSVTCAAHITHQLSNSVLQLLGPEGVQLPNGLDWNMKKGVMYFNDSINSHNKPPSGTIWEFKTDKLGVPIDTRDGSAHTR